MANEHSFCRLSASIALRDLAKKNPQLAGEIRRAGVTWTRTGSSRTYFVELTGSDVRERRACCAYEARSQVALLELERIESAADQLETILERRDQLAGMKDRELDQLEANLALDRAEEELDSDLARAGTPEPTTEEIERFARDNAAEVRSLVELRVLTSRKGAAVLAVLDRDPAAYLSMSVSDRVDLARDLA